MKFPLFCTVLVIAFLQTSLADDVYKHALVRSPQSLQSLFPTGIPARPALFGVDTSSTTSTVHTSSDPYIRQGCQPLHPADFERSANPDRNSDFIVLLSSGNCSNVQKAYHSQALLGSVALIIIDESGADVLPYILDDDPSVSPAIHIAVMMISREDGARLVAAALQTTKPLLSIDFGTPIRDRVQWQYWTSSSDGHTVALKASFGVAAALLGSASQMEPLYYLLPGEDYHNCKNNPSSNDCQIHCSNNGRYCSLGTEAFYAKYVIQENVRQYCLWQYLNQTQTTYKWWQYVSRFEATCAQSQYHFIQPRCRNGILDEIYVPHDVVQNCVDKSGGFGNNDNHILEGFSKAMKRDGVVYGEPQLFVNGQPYTGSMSCPYPLRYSTCPVLQHVCNAYTFSAQSQACIAGQCPIGRTLDRCGVCGGDGTTCKDQTAPSSSGLSPGAVVGIVIGVVSVVAIIGVFAILKHRQSLQMDVDRILRSYLPSDDERRVPLQTEPRDGDVLDNEDGADEHDSDADMRL